jgi:hypothetical protein
MSQSARDLEIADRSSERRPPCGFASALPCSCSRSPSSRAAASDASGPLRVTPPHFSTDKSVELDYDIVYVRARARGDAVGTNWPEISSPLFMDAALISCSCTPTAAKKYWCAAGPAR